MTDTLARICARRPWWTVALWGLAVLVGLVLVRELLGSATTTELSLTTEVEADRATTLLDSRLRPVPEPVTEVVVVQSDSLTVDLRVPYCELSPGPSCYRCRSHARHRAALTVVHKEP